jgi:hypothetical protein
MTTLSTPKASRSTTAASASCRSGHPHRGPHALRGQLDSNNIIRNAVSTGTMWRGLEVILKGRDPRDAWAFVSASAACAPAPTR